MIKNIAWNVFKSTGNIDTFLEFKQIRDIENGNTNGISLNGDIANEGIIPQNGGIPTNQKVELNGDNQNQWNNNF